MFEAHTPNYAIRITQQAKRWAGQLRMADAWILNPTEESQLRGVKFRLFTDHYKYYFDDLEQYAGRVSGGAAYEAEQQRIERAGEEAIRRGIPFVTVDKVDVLELALFHLIVLDEEKRAADRAAFRAHELAEAECAKMERKKEIQGFKSHAKNRRDKSDW